MLDVDKGLEEIGTFGLWHFSAYFWITYVNIFGAMVTSCIVFMEEIPDFICENSLHGQTNWTFEQIRSISTPKHTKGGGYDGCRYYVRDYSKYYRLPFSMAQEEILMSNHTAEIKACAGGKYNWDTSDGMKLSIVNQWSLVCDQNFQVSNALTVYLAGFFFGCLAASFLGDRYGRKLVIAVTGTLSGILSIADAFIPNIYGFLIGRFFLGFFVNVKCPVIYVLVRDWRILQAAVGAPLLISPILYWLLPESPRWLVLQGRDEEARKTLERAARWNGKISNHQLQLSKAPFLFETKEKEESVKKETKRKESLNFFVVFQHWKLALRTLNICYNWIATALVYNGIYFLITSFSGDIFVNNAISGALGAPSYILCWPLLLWSRTKSYIVLLFAAGSSSLLYLIVPEAMQWAKLVAVFVTKLAITAAFNILHLITAELYPDGIRTAAVSLGIMVARVGSITAAWILIIARKNEYLIWIVMTVFGAASLTAGLLSFFIPETQNQPMPETLEDAINYPPKRKMEKETTNGKCFE